MKTSRMEAFSDGVLAIVITIMVLEMKVPHGDDWSALTPMFPVFGSYVMSFVYIGIYWNNHHHLLHATDNITGKVLWTNLHLLFWLSLIPFVTGWMGENHFTALPTALYGTVLLMAAIAWLLLQASLVSCAVNNKRLREAIGKDAKGKWSVVLYVASIGLSFVQPWVAVTIYAGVALMWFIPDRRFENAYPRTSDGQL
jgi:uncharacterized membrane protein